MSLFPGFFRARKWLARFAAAKEGNIAVIFAIAAIPVIGSIGTAVDFAEANDVSVRLQAALDAAVLAGATQPSAQQMTVAANVFDGDFTTKFATSATRSFVQNADGSLSGAASSSVKASFLGVFGISSIPVSAKASASAGVLSKTPVCILLVNTTKSQPLLVNSGAQITAQDCEIDIPSTQSLMFNTTLNVRNICFKGSSATKNGGANPPLQTNCAAISNPFVGKLPSVTAGSCDHNNQTYDSTTNKLDPGVYCGWTNFNGSGTLTLDPGLYVISGGGMTFNSGWNITGTGVTFYLVDQNATITFNNNVNANLSAPITGTYANILVYEPDGLSNTNLPINGSSGDNFSGLIYLPSRDVTINSTSNLTYTNTSMVFSTLTLNATNWLLYSGATSMSRSTGTAATAHLTR